MHNLPVAVFIARHLDYLILYYTLVFVNCRIAPIVMGTPLTSSLTSAP